MLLTGTEMHMVTFAIVIFELVILFFQLFYFLERPSDQQRRWYLILLCLLISYNVAGGLFPDPSIPIPIVLQNIFAYGTAIAVSMFLAFYLYKAFDLKHLKRFALYGPFICILLPFLVMFIVPYLLTGNIDFARKLVVFIPGIYGFVFLYALTLSLKKKYVGLDPSQRGVIFKEQAIYAYLGLFFWLSLPVITYYDLGQVWEVVMTNAGFIAMTIAYVRFSVLRSKTEFSRLQSLNLEFEKQVKAQTLELERANEQKTTNFINLAHETKTPLTLINNYLADYITKKGLDEDLAIVKYNLDKLTTDITNYFDLERFDRGLDVYDHEQVTDFSATLSNSLSLFRSLAQNKQITINEEIMKQVLVRIDPEAVVRIINNIVENAIKYTEKGGKITVILRAVERLAVFEVSDTGQGIPLHLRDKVLEPYFQASHEKKNSQGIGMGLSIVNKIVNSVGGSIKLEDNSQKGTLVTISVPLQREKVDYSEIQAPYSSYSIIDHEYDTQDYIYDENRPYVLVVEDNPSMLQYLKQKLSERYNVYTALSGQQALEKVKTVNQLDIIISDVMMDQIDGFRFVEIIKSQPKYSHIPILFLTAKTRNADRQKGFTLGAHDYIAKPFESGLLLKKVENILNDAKSQRYALIDSVYTQLMGDANGANSTSSPNIFIENCKLFQLSKREIEVAQLVNKGYSTVQLSEELSISERTVTTHLQNIFRKVGVKSQIELLNKLKTNSSD